MIESYDWFRISSLCLLRGKGLQSLAALAIEDMAEEVLEENLKKREEHNGRNSGE